MHTHRANIISTNDHLHLPTSALDFNSVHCAHNLSLRTSLLAWFLLRFAFFRFFHSFLLSLLQPLSETGPRSFPQIEQYFSVLCSRLRHRKSFEFRLGLTPSFYVNEDRSRSFAALDVAAGKLEFRALIGRVNDAMREFRQEQYYADPKPHTSIGWALGDAAAPFATCGSGDSADEHPQVPELEYMAFRCEEVVFRSGVYDYVVKLQ